MTDIHPSLADVEDETLQGLVKRQLDVTLGNLPVPNFMNGTTKAVNLASWLEFVHQGDVITQVNLNALPVKEGLLQPSVFGRRMHAVYAAIAAFVGDVASVSKKEIIMGFDPNLEQVDKVRYTIEEVTWGRYPGEFWIEWNWRDGKFVQSGRRQFPATQRIRVGGIRLPQSVIEQLDGLKMLLAGRKIVVGTDRQAQFAKWLNGLIADGKTVAEYLKERDEAWAAKATNAAAQAEARLGASRHQDVTTVVLKGSPTLLSLLADGTYSVHIAGEKVVNITLQKGNSESEGRIRALAARGAWFGDPVKF